jgi:hypothetical protein
LGWASRVHGNRVAGTSAFQNGVWEQEKAWDPSGLSDLLDR